jgi:GxxExxY protein
MMGRTTNKPVSSTEVAVHDLVYPELSYRIMGLLFDVHNKLGTTYQEKHYQRAIEIKLRESNIQYKREHEVDLTFEGKYLGKFLLDFIVDGSIILEIKTVPLITNDIIRQVLRYLENTSLKLAIIANFRQMPLEYRRVVL